MYSLDKVRHHFLAGSVTATLNYGYWNLEPDNSFNDEKDADS